MPADSLLVSRLRRGDSQALSEAYEEHRRPVFGYLLRLTRNRPLAEDLLQDTFLRFARAAPRLDEHSRLLPFLLTIARNAWISHRRQSLLDLDRTRQMGLWMGQSTSPGNPEDEAMGNEARSRIERALLTLPLPLREALLLVAVLGLDHPDAAVVLDITEVNLRQRISRARAALAVLLEQP